jgi:dihydroorotase
MTPELDLVLRDVVVPYAALGEKERGPGGVAERAPLGAPVRLDVGVRDGRIVVVERALLHGRVEVQGGGALLLPGLVDNHVHYREPGLTHKEGYVSGTCASVRGGATTVGEVQNNAPLIRTVHHWRAKVASVQPRARSRVMVYGCAVKDNVGEVRELARYAPALKLFLAADAELEVSDPATLRAIFHEVAAADGLLVLHAEMGPLVRAGLEKFGARAADFSKARSAEAEEAAVELCVETCASTGARIHFFHVSSARGCEAIRNAKRRKLPVSGAACAHYLMFSEEDVARLGAVLKCNPSIKSLADRDALRAAVRDGTLDVVQSDHAPHLVVEKERRFADAPSGIPGADLLASLWLELVSDGVLTLDQFVERATVGPAQLHRLADRGRVTVGALADLTLVEERPWRVEARDFASKAKLSPYTGRPFLWRVAKTWVGGRLVFDREQPEDVDALERAAPSPIETVGPTTPGCC